MQSTFIIAAISVLTIPGLAIGCALKIKKQLMLTSIAVSYSVFIVIFLLLSSSKNLTSYLVNTYAIIITISLLFIAFHTIKNKTSLFLNRDALAISSIACFVFSYIYFTGAFTEVPSDLYTHLERYQYAHSKLSASIPINQSKLILFLLQNHVWYYFLSLNAIAFPLSSAQLIESTAFITNFIFLVSIYCFSAAVFNKKKNVVFIALASCAFIFLHFGINVFSFIRYYSFGPTNIGFCLYFAAISHLLICINRNANSNILVSLITFVFLTFIAFCNHMQEALFILVISSIMIGIYWLGLIKNNLGFPQTVKISTSLWTVSVLGIFFCFIATYLYAHLYLEREPNVHWRLWEFGKGIGLMPDLTTLNLKFQFIRVFTLWGCFVYCLFLMNLRRYRHNAFILAGMVSPFFTILNPFFVDLFLRIDKSTTLWRLVWIVPIHFVAADLFIHYLDKFRTSNKVKKTIYFCTASMLIVLLLPIKNTWQQVHYSRITTLQPTQLENSHYYYSDLLEFLDTLQDRKSVLTDPITGYIISAMTHHKNYRYKFFRGMSFQHFTFLDYDENTFSNYKGWLLIVNKRNQFASNVGKLSGHWAEKELLQIDNYYPDQLTNHIQKNSQLFDKIWSDNGVSIYQIR